MTYLLAALVAAQVAALTGTAWAVYRLSVVLFEYFDRMATALEREPAEPEADLSRKIRDLEYEIELLPKTWEEFRNASDRAERRARSIVKDAQKELAGFGIEHAGLNAQAHELRVSDGGLSETEGVQPLHTGVEHGPASIVDWRARAREVKYG